MNFLKLLIIMMISSLLIQAICIIISIWGIIKIYEKIGRKNLSFHKGT